MDATMTATAIGTFYWPQVRTNDKAKTTAFYTELLDWGIAPFDMGGGDRYDMLTNHGEAFGGVMPLDPDEAGVPAHWISSIIVASVDDTAASAQAHGGAVLMPPSDIPEVGRFSVIADPLGATIALFSSKGSEDAAQSAPAQGMPPVGGVAWNELMSVDPAAVQGFYETVFGWTAEQVDMGAPYTVFKIGDGFVGGILRAPADLPRSSWVIYFHVADLDASLDKVTRLGGEPKWEIIPVPTIGRVAWATDPTGALFALMEPEKA
jgi:predicted enzyme related to lactoylglutathione lyase